MLYVGAEPSPAHIASRLGAGTGEPVFARRKLMFANDIPVRIATSYFPLALAEDTPLAAPDFVEGGLQVALEAMGRRFGRAVEALTARMPSPEEADTLQLEADAPVVQVIRSSYDVHDEPIHTLETICAANRHVFYVRHAENNDVF